MAINPGWPVAIRLPPLLALTLATYAVGDSPNAPGTAVAAGRAVLQLGVAAPSSPAWCAPVVVDRCCVDVHDRRRDDRPADRGPQCVAWATLAMLAGLVPVVAIILLTRTVPPTGIALIPVVGILAGNTMNGHTLTCRRTFAALREHGQYEAALSLGMTRAQAIAEIIPPSGARGADPGARPGPHRGRGDPSRCLHRRAQGRDTGPIWRPPGARAARDHGRPTVTAVVAEHLVMQAAAAAGGPAGNAAAPLVRRRFLVSSTVPLMSGGCRRQPVAGLLVHPDQPLTGVSGEAKGHVGRGPGWRRNSMTVARPKPVPAGQEPP